MRKYMRLERLTVAALVLCMGCVAKPDPASPGAGTTPGAQAKDIVIPVEAQTPMRGDISSYLKTTTRVEAERRVDVTAQAIGKCAQVNVDEGDMVKKGDLLAELDKEESQAALTQAEVQVAKQKLDFARAKYGVESGITAPMEYDAAKAAYEQGKANLEIRRVQFSNLTIRAPIGGVITKRNIQLGQLVSTGVPVFSIVDPSSYMLVINPVDRDLPRLSEGQAAKVTVDALGDREFDTTIRRVNPSVDPLTGTVKVVLDFQEQDRKALLEGAFARVQLVLETHTGALLLPKDALLEENGRHYVFVVRPEGEQPTGEAAESKGETASDAADKVSKERERVELASLGTSADAAEADPSDEPPKNEPTFMVDRIEVGAGLEDSARIEVLSGISEDSLVVTEGQHTLKPGAKVKLTNADTELLKKAQISLETALETAKAKRAKGEEYETSDSGHHRH